MAKSISVYRRRAGLVDLTVRQRDGVRAFIFKASTNFDVAVSPIQQIPSGGFRSPNAFDSGPAEGFRGLCRFTFKPSDYSLDDTKPIWLRIQPINADGSLGADEPYHLVMPYAAQGRRPVILNGTAPNAALGAALELNLQYQCQNLELQNNGAVDMFVSFEAGGPEFVVKPLSTGFTNLSTVYPAFSQLFIRGNGSTVAFSAVMSARDERA